jgi:hypothetical protein
MQWETNFHLDDPAGTRCGSLLIMSMLGKFKCSLYFVKDAFTDVLSPLVTSDFIFIYTKTVHYFSHVINKKCWKEQLYLISLHNCFI